MNNQIDLDLKVALGKVFAAGVKEDQIKDLDIIVLPENFGDPSEADFDAQDAITLSKLLKEKNVKCANSYDLNLDVPTKERRSNDIWLGQLYIINDGILPIITGVIGSLLAAIIYERKTRKDKKAPAANVHTELTVNKKEGITNIKYSGDPETLVKIMEILQEKENE